MVKQTKKKVLGRWFEALGISLVSGAIVTFPIAGIKYWYFFITGLIVLLFGTYWYENNSEQK